MTHAHRLRLMIPALLITLVVVACGSRSKPAASAPGSGTATSTTTAAQSLDSRPTSSIKPACAGGAPGGSTQAGGDVLVPGDIPDNQAFVAFTSTSGYQLVVPEGWARQESGAAVTFTDKFNTIHVAVTASPAPPSAAIAQSTEVPQLAGTVPCFQSGTVTRVTRKAGPAVLITYRGNSAPDTVTGKSVLEDIERYEFWRNGKQATITLSSPKGSDNVDPWRRVTDSFAWT